MAIDPSSFDVSREEQADPGEDLVKCHVMEEKPEENGGFMVVSWWFHGGLMFF